MPDCNHDNQLQCIVDEGILLNRRDMVRLLRDLGLVRYVDLHSGETRASGEGYVTSVVANQINSTIIANRRLYLNVNNFEYLKLGLDAGQTFFDLVDRDRIVRIIPLDCALTPPPVTTEDAFGSGRVANGFRDALAEVYFDDEEDDDDF